MKIQHKVSCCSSDSRFHKFVHVSGKEIVSIIHEAEINAKLWFNLPVSSIEMLKSGKALLIKGWRYEGLVS